MNVFQGKRIVLGVTGSIAIYKSITLASHLTQQGAVVDVVLTDAATKLVTPLTFESVTGRRAYQEEDLWDGGSHVLHIELGEKNDLFLIAPATANTIAKLAHGMADNLLTLSALASRTTPLIAPAMDGGMYVNPATRDNIEILQERGYRILGPAEGHLASGLEGKGRMLEPEKIIAHLRLVLAQGGPLTEKMVLVTAGGTQEALDPVRVLTNRSSGKQGYALARSALDVGAKVVLVTAPAALDPPVGAEVIQVTSAEEMKEAVLDRVKGCDILFMAAAVADYQPRYRSRDKMKKDQRPTLALEMESTPDILDAVAEHRRQHGKPEYVVGFAAETENLVGNAKKKLASKELDLLAANDVTDPEAGFDVDTNRVTLIYKDGRVEDWPLLDKSEVADKLIELVIEEGKNSV